MTPTCNVTTYDAYYNADTDNYVDADIKVTIKLDKATVTLENLTFEDVYIGKLIEFTPTVSFNGKTLDSSNYTLYYVPADTISGGSKTYSGFTVDYSLTKSVANGCVNKNDTSIDTNSIGFTDGGTWKPTVSLSSQNYKMDDTTITIKVKSVVLSTATGTLLNIDDALKDATSNQIIVVKENTYINEEATVNSGVTLLVPYSSALDTTIQPTEGYATESSSIYRTLTLSSSTKLIINANAILNVSGVQSANMPHTGYVSGACGYMSLLSGSLVDVYGTLYASGYIIGDGQVSLNSGGIGYENLDIKDWPGGTAATACQFVSISQPKFFPFSQFKVANIKSKFVVNYGAKLYVHYYIEARGSQMGNVEMFGVSGLFALTKEGSYIEKKVDNDTGKIQITTYGDIETKNMSVSVGGITSVDTEGDEIPICGYYDLIVCSGTITVKSKVKLLPGASFKLCEGAKCYIEADEDYGIIGYMGTSPLNTVINSCTYGDGIIYSGSDPVTMLINGSIIIKEEYTSWFQKKWRSGCFGGIITTSSKNASITLANNANISGNIKASCITDGLTSRTVESPNYSLSLNGISSPSAGNTYYGRADGTWSTTQVS